MQQYQEKHSLKLQFWSKILGDKEVYNKCREVIANAQSYKWITDTNVHLHYRDKKKQKPFMLTHFVAMSGHMEKQYSERVKDETFLEFLEVSTHNMF